MQRNYALDFQKFIFAVIVVLFHSTSMATTEAEKIFITGRISVEFFFIVSGCLMCASAMKAREQDLTLGLDTLNFIKRKIFNLMPNFVIAHIIAFIVYHVNAADVTIKMLCIDAITSLPELLLIKNCGVRSYSFNGVTWYLSAMILGMVLLYPLVRKYKDTFFYVIAPLAFLGLMGYMFQTYGSLSNLEHWNGFMLNGTMRAVADMLGGCICYTIATHLKKFEFAPVLRVLFTFMEWGCYIVSIVFVYDHHPSQYDYFIFLLFMIGVIITYSQISYDEKIFKHRIFGWLGSYSLSLYLGHSYWRAYNDNIFPTYWDFNDKLTAYLILAFLTGLFIMYTSIALRKLWGKYGPSITSKLIARR